MAQATYGNGTLYVAEQNARQLLRNLTYGQGSTLHLSEDLSYDKNGNITQVADLAGGPRSKTLGYDALNRLISATAPALWGTETYAYDPLNNIRQRVTGTQTTTYHYDSHNRLSSLTGAGATSFGYDSRGNVTSNGGVTLTFDQNNQLLSLPGASYAYDASGRRVKKTVSGVDTYYFYSQAGDLLHQWEPATNKTTNFYQLGRRTIARGMRVGTAARTVIYSYTDAQNTPLMRADAGGAVTATFGYTPYGRIAIGGPANGAGYTGHVNDPESGLVYMQARYYDPSTGRFLSTDPVGPSPGSLFHFNRYGYANNNPVRFTDPLGLAPEDEQQPEQKSSCDEMCKIMEEYRRTNRPWTKSWEAVGEGAETAGDAVETTYEAMLPLPVAKLGFFGRIAKALGLSKPVAKVGPKVAKQMERRGWTPQTIHDAVNSGKQFKAVNKATGRPATRYVNPTTGQSVVVDNATGEVIHVGGRGFRYGTDSGDIP